MERAFVRLGVLKEQIQLGGIEGECEARYLQSR